MPDLITHYYHGAQVFDGLPERVRRVIDRPLYNFTTAGPDPWFSLGFPNKKRKALSGRGTILHAQKTDDFLRALAEAAKARPESRGALFSYLAGYLCHYGLDSFCHPYIIHKTGEYKPDDPAARLFRGQHIRFERAIDSHLLRTVYHSVPWRYNPFREVLTLKTLPASLREGLNEVYGRVYGFENAYGDLCHAVKDERHFFFFAFDRFGLCWRWLRRTDKGYGEDIKQYSYWHRDIDPAVYDVLNEAHTPWANPWDASLVSTESFFELFERARAFTAAAVEACYDYVYGDAPYPAALIGRRSYSSGLDWDDPRLGNTPVYDESFARLGL